MPRKVVPISSEFPYSISARCINKEWFKIPMSTVWGIMEDYLSFLHYGFDFKIKSFVLMSNHFHLIAQAPLGNLSEGMNYFMRETSRQIGKEAGRINQIYGSRFYRSMITKNHYYQHAYKYVYRNPVEAGIVLSPEDYKFSTLGGLIGKRTLYIPIEYDEILFESFDSTLNWLNQAPKKEHYESVRKALRKGTFQLVTDRKTKKYNSLENENY